MKKSVELESKQVLKNISKQKDKYFLKMKISMIIWLCCSYLALVNIWCIIPYLISGIITLIYMKKYFSIIDEMIDTIEILYKRMKIS